MTVEKVRELYSAEQFVPFVIHMADGRAIEVPHREFMAIAPTGRMVAVFTRDDRTHFVDLLLVTDLETKHNGSKRRKS